ncbi:sulfatase [Thalassoglobus sp. JC818]|uniref:sulfatase n=1 Tax=Thalassoglobus sp. JC818 TaxID=3232136 RepID=UPI00345849CA
MTIPSNIRLLIAGLATLCIVIHHNDEVKAADRPNVLMIAVDDLRPELACFGASHIHSPNIDRLAQSGVRFHRAYCQVAVCGASRASLMSGCRPETTQCWDYKTPLRAKMPEVLTLPQHFRNNGYETTFLGKVYHSRTDDPQGWSLSADSIAPADRNKGKGYVLPRAPLPKQRSAKANQKTGPAFENGGDVPDDAYTDGHTADRAVKVMQHLATQDKPFFFAVGFLKPHLPFNAPAKYWDLYDRSSIQIPSREDVIDGVPYAGSGWGELKNYPGIPNNVPYLDDELSAELIHGYYAAVSYTDAQVGKLLDELDRLNLRENTIVVLWGDHGWYVGDFGDWCKHTNYEIATRVPLIVSAPGITDNQESKALVEFVDIFPTLSELANLEIPEHCHGQSFVPVLNEPDREWKQAAFSQYRKSKPPGTPMLGTSIRTNQFRYTEWRHRDTGELDAIELIDFESDPGATRNVAADAAYAQFLPELAELCAESGKGVRAQSVATSSP